MTATSSERLETSFARTPRSRRPQWRCALRALRRLLRDPNATENAFEVIAALDPEPMQGGLESMLSLRKGGGCSSSGRACWITSQTAPRWRGFRTAASGARISRTSNVGDSIPASWWRSARIRCACPVGRRRRALGLPSAAGSDTTCTTC